MSSNYFKNVWNCKECMWVHEKEAVDCLRKPLEELLEETDDLKTKKKVEEMNSKKLLYALKQYSIANTKTVIQKPKEYFKKCNLSAIGQTELSTQYDAYTIEMGAVL